MNFLYLIVHDWGRILARRKQVKNNIHDETKKEPDMTKCFKNSMTRYLR